VCTYPQKEDWHEASVSKAKGFANLDQLVRVALGRISGTLDSGKPGKKPVLWVSTASWKERTRFASGMNSKRTQFMS